VYRNCDGNGPALTIIMEIPSDLGKRDELAMVSSKYGIYFMGRSESLSGLEFQ
jgi:hypothetical protein